MFMLFCVCMYLIILCLCVGHWIWRKSISGNNLMPRIISFHKMNLCIASAKFLASNNIVPVSDLRTCNFLVHQDNLKLGVSLSDFGIALGFSLLLWVPTINAKVHSSGKTWASHVVPMDLYICQNFYSVLQVPY